MRLPNNDKLYLDDFRVAYAVRSAWAFDVRRRMLNHFTSTGNLQTHRRLLLQT